jgi:hypothetical protein
MSAEEKESARTAEAKDEAVAFTKVVGIRTIINDDGLIAGGCTC